MFNLGVPELILILVVGLVVFGPKKLPEIGRSVGKGLREFKKAINDIKQNIDIESEFKEVADIKKEVTEIKTGLKEAVLGPDTPANSGSLVNTTQIERMQAEQSIVGEEAENVTDPKRSWTKNNIEWTMPEWANQEQNEKLEEKSLAEENESQDNGV